MSAVPDYCMAHGCGSKKGRLTGGKLVSMHRIPRNKARGVIWILNMGRIDLFDEEPDYWYENGRVCQKHFLDEMYMNTKDKVLRLVHDAAPSEFGSPNLAKLASGKSVTLSIRRRAESTL